MLRVFAGDFVAGEIDGEPVAESMYLLAAVVLLPIVMVVLSLTLPDPAIRWASIGVAVFMVVFNLIGLPYPGLYDNFLIVVSIVFCALIVWYAWRWKVPV